VRGWDEGISGFSYVKAEVNDIPHLHNVIFSLDLHQDKEISHRGIKVA
jgi:hypothetical protein